MNKGKKKPDLTSIMVATHDVRFSPFYWQAFESSVPIKKSNKANLLDLGTGPGLFLQNINERYPKITATGIDESQAMVSFARSLKLPLTKTGIYKKDISSKNFTVKDQPFKFITMNFVFHHLTSPLCLLDNLKNGLLAKKGFFVIYDWVSTALEDYLEFHKLMGREMTEDTAFEMFSEHGKYSTDDLEWLLCREGFKLKEKNDITNLHSLMVFQLK